MGKEIGEEGLEDESRRPLSSPNKKVGKQEESLILDLRRTLKLGARRILNELMREHQLSLSLATIHKVLKRHQIKLLKRHRKKFDYIRYSRPISGDRF